MISTDSITQAANAFSRTIASKLAIFREVVQKKPNPALSGAFIEQLVRGFIRDWIKPCERLHGTLSPIDFNPEFYDPKAPQIDGIVFDSRLGPPIIREDEFIITDPRFCRGVVEIKKSVNDRPELLALRDRLNGIHSQFFVRGSNVIDSSCLMGVVIHDANPQKSSRPSCLQAGQTLFEIHESPIFILFTEAGDSGNYQPHTEAIEAMMRRIFDASWSSDRKTLERIKQLETGLRLHNRTSQ